MDDQVKIYDTVRGNQLLYYNQGYNTTNSTKLKKSSNQWTNIFTWKKKSKQPVNSIINYPFMPQKYCSVSAATGISYALAPPVRQAGHPTPFATPDLLQEYISSTTTTTTTVQTSVRHNPLHRQVSNRNSLFYSPWESFHDHSARQSTKDCTCHSSQPSVADTYEPSKSKPLSVRGVSSKSVPTITSTTEPVYDSRRLSRMDLYSVEEENTYQKVIDSRSKSSDSLLDMKKSVQPSNGMKSCRSSTTLNGNPFVYKPNKSRDVSSATVNERFLKFFKKPSADPFNSIASRKSILECDVTAYDLIKQNVEQKMFEEDDIDDSLSDNAIENENKCEDSASKSAKVKSEIGETRHALTASSVRIGGIGMSLTGPHKFKSNSHNKSTKSYSTSKPSDPPSSNSWSSSGMSSDDSIPLPEPDYDIDDDYDTYTSSTYDTNRFEAVAYSSTLSSTNTSHDNERQAVVNKYDGSDKQAGFSSREYFEYDNRYDDCQPDSQLREAPKSQMPSVAGPPPLPPPAPPEPPLPVRNQTLVTKTLTNSVQPKASPPTPSVSAYQCELKDKLNSGVKSILKKARNQFNSDNLAKDHCLSKSETNLNDESTDQSNSCDYLRTFKEFKESRLRANGRHRKHVHFKSLSHDRLISNETIPEVEESDEPIYDDVRLPGQSNSSDDDQHSTDDHIENNANDTNVCLDSEQLNAISESITSDNSIIRSDCNDFQDNWLTNDTPVVAGPVEFSEFDPSEEPSSSSSSTATANKGRAKLEAKASLASPTKLRHNWLDLNAHNNSLTESHNRFQENNDNYSRSGANTQNPCEGPVRPSDAMKGPVCSPKNLMPSPAATSTPTQHLRNNTAADYDYHSLAQSFDQMREPVVQTRCLTTAVGQTPVAKPRDDRLQGRTNQVKSEMKAPVAQARAHKPCLNSGLTSNKSYLLAKEETIGDQKCKEITSQTLLPVSQDSERSEHQNFSQTNKNFVQLSDTNVSRCENQNKKHFTNNNNNTEIRVSDEFNRRHSLTANESTIDDNCLPFGTGSALESRPQMDDYNPYVSKTNPYLCTISIKNGSNNQIINQTGIDTSVHNVCLSAASAQFESFSSQSSSSFYDSGAQSSIDSLTNDRSLKSLEDSPITILCANLEDKIVINVPSDHTFDNINEHIYEELEPIYVDTDDSLENVKSIFDGASKDEILEFLEDAKERVGEDILVDTTNIGIGIEANIDLLEAIDVIEDIEGSLISTSNRLEMSVPSSSRRNRTSNVSNSSTDSTATTTSSSIDIEDDILKCAITNSSSVGQLVERNDSGVGAETSKPSRHRKLSLNDEVEHQCADCEMHVDPNEDDETGLLHYPLFCHRCDKKRSERKEIISEIVDTEFKYGRDLRIIREEFYRPIEIAGLLSKEQLRGLFLNLDELIGVNSKFSEKLQDAIDIATEQGDEDFTTVNIGKLFRESSSMLHAFEAYCVRQGSAALLLNHLEKEKELLRIFLRVSQMENTLLRRMNLRSFLVVPVQRVTKYPLLLNRLYKVTPYHHRDREALRECQQKVELHLEHINQQTKGTIGATSRIWRRISNLSTSHRRLNNTDDIGNIKLRKAALEILKWNQEETQFVLIGKVFFTSITDYTVNRKAKTMKFLTGSALLATLGRPNQNYRPDLVNKTDADKDMLFNRDNTGISDAVLLLLKEKCGRYALCKEIMNLKSCVVSTELENCDEMFEIHEQITKESLLFKADNVTETRAWLKQLKYHSKDLGNWRRRRNALANIMMVRQ